MITATVREWYEEEGWGVLDSAETPGGCFAHFSDIEMAGLPHPRPGSAGPARMGGARFPAGRLRLPRPPSDSLTPRPSMVATRTLPPLPGRSLRRYRTRVPATGESRCVAPLPGGAHERQQPAAAVGGEVDLRGQSAAGPPMAWSTGSQAGALFCGPRPQAGEPARSWSPPRPPS